MTQFLIDEGYDCTHAMDAVGAGALDEDVLKCAEREDRILLTYDHNNFSTESFLKTFSHPGIIVVRLNKKSPIAIFNTLKLLFKKCSLTTLRDSRIILEKDTYKRIHLGVGEETLRLK